MPRHERFEQVHALLGRGRSITAIGRTLHLTRKIVRKYASASSADAASTRRTSPGPSPLLTPFLTYRNRRWQQGCENGKVLLDEIRARGYRGRRRTLSRSVTARHRGARPPEPRSTPPSPRSIASLILRRPDYVDAAEEQQLAEIGERCPELSTTTDLARSFASILRERQGAGPFQTGCRRQEGLECLDWCPSQPDCGEMRRP